MPQQNQSNETNFKNHAAAAGATGIKRILLSLVIVAAVMALRQDASAATNVLHFNFKTTMTSVDSAFGGVDARGKVDGVLTRRGTTSNQKLVVALTKLNPNTGYKLVAFLGDETNATSIGNFTTDHKGAFQVVYVKNGDKPTPRGRQALPAVLDPLCNIRELVVVNESAEPVMRAALNNPDRGPYMVSGPLKNSGFLSAAAGNFRIAANTRSTRFRLIASGLVPNVNYLLAINGNVIQTNTSNGKGKLTLTTLPDGSPNVLDIHTLALTDNTSTNIVLVAGGFGVPCTTSAQTSFRLGTATGFAVLAGSEVTSTGNTEVTGDLGVWAGSSVSGFQGIVTGGPGVVHGTIHAGNSAAQIAQGDLTTAYNDAAGRTLAPIDVANADLGGRTLAPGLYKSSGTLALTGTVTLDAQGDINGVFIFQIAAALNTATGSQVILSGGAKAANVFWQVGSSATLGTTTVFKGTIMADQSISLATGATLEGRALARIGAVTMDSNIITLPTP